jgi:lysophospholipase L1-like esterase
MRGPLIERGTVSRTPVFVKQVRTCPRVVLIMTIARRALALCLLGLLAAVPAASAASYVALGDSYVAGPAIPLPIKPWGCLKSDHNYAHLSAPRLGLDLRDPSCSGAETEDMTAMQGVWPDPNPPQFDALAADTTLVTLGIGGNDIGFSSLAQDCFSQSPQGSPCKDRYTAGGSDQVSQRIADTAPKVASVLQGIHTRAPNAKVLVVNYPAILPDSGAGCWPVIPVAAGDAVWLRDKERELNQMLADQAAASGAALVDWYTPSIGHDACQPPGIKWVEGLVPNSGLAPVHPNLLGMLAAADLVTAAGA